MTPPTVLLDARQLDKSYGRIAVLHDVSLQIGADEAHVVIGPNGAGKTTLFKVLTGEVQANRGAVFFRGEELTRLSAHQRVQRGFGRTFQVARVFGKLSVQDNLRVALEAHRRRAHPWVGLGREALRGIAQAIEQGLAEIGLAHQREVLAATLAYGDRKRLELAMVLALDPALLFLDEPTAGMSAAERQATVQLLRSVRQQRRLAMLLTEHDMDVVFGLADRISVLHHGRLIASGTPAAIRADARVQEVYLGQEDHDA
jgi:branched-chain amino acid transport system ATP-binding protein